MSLFLVCVSRFPAVAQFTPAPADEASDERHFESLTVGALSFTNVWVHRQTNEVILIRHSMGIHSIKLSDLPSDELLELKSQVGHLAEVGPAKAAGRNGSALVEKVLNLLNGSSSRNKTITGVVLFLFLMLIVSKFRGRKNAVAT